jgi:hypothetical protein
LARAFPVKGESIMALRLAVLTVLALALVFGISSGSPQQQDKEKTRLLNAQMDAARKTFETLWTDKEFRNVDTAYLWSRRWLDVQRLLNDKKQDQVAAVHEHLQRMQRLKTLMDQLWQQKLATRDQLTATDYYVAEAELWILQAQK